MAGEQMSFKLNTGALMPAVGLGTWQAAPGEVGAAVATALEAGYTHIDCAHIYQNEPEIGEALTAAFKKGTIKRSELFVTSKLWCYDFLPEDVLPACEKTLKELQLDYLDLYLMHVPAALKRDSSFPPKLEDLVSGWEAIATWRAMEQLVHKGLCKAIGVSNFTVKKLETLKAGGISITPAVNQVELHPMWRQDKLMAYCAKEGIHVSAYSPLGSPARPAFARVTETPVLLELPVLVETAKKLGKTPGQVALRWGIQHGVDVLPKSTNPKRIKENLDVLGWSIPEEDFKALSSIQPQMRILDFKGLWVGEGLPFKTLEEFWDGEV